MDENQIDVTDIDELEDGPELKQDEDVQDAIEGKLGDGPGDLDALPESDFDGYAEDDVEKEQEDD